MAEKGAVLGFFSRTFHSIRSLLTDHDSSGHEHVFNKQRGGRKVNNNQSVIRHRRDEHHDHTGRRSAHKRHHDLQELAHDKGHS